MTGTGMDGAGETDGRATRRQVLQATGTALAVGGLAESTAAQASGPTVYVGSEDGNVYAVDAGSGEEVWLFETGEAVESSPTVVDGTVYVGNGSIDSVDSNLYAVDATSGEEQWRFDIDGAVESSPTVADSTVYFGSVNLDSKNDGVSTGDDGSVFALDTTSGEEVWRFETYHPVEYAPTVADGTVYVVSRNLYAVDAASGGESGFSILRIISGPHQQ